MRIGLDTDVSTATIYCWSGPSEAVAACRSEEGVALAIHYCVLWNAAAVAHHPDWAAVNAQG
jgi:hypothetical protein